MPFEAKHRFARISPRKARLIMNLIRGRSVDDALNLLKFSKQRSSVMIEKVVKSAVANAENNNSLSADQLTVHRALVECGPVLKRFKAGAKGSAKPRVKRMSHLRIILSDGKSN